MTRAGGAAPLGPTPRELDAPVRSVVQWLDQKTGEHHSPTFASGSGPLAGMRLGVKDNIRIAGVPTTCGSRFGLGWAADEDAAVITTLRDAGATITATLDMAELAVGVTSQNSVHGGPRNPWDLTRVPAGSSGGSGAAVAAGVVDAALGTDTGGSIRLPASACGITGLRPTPGAVDVTGTIPVSPSFDTVGPMARDAATVEKIFHVLQTRKPFRESAPPRTVGLPGLFVTEDIDPAIAALTTQMAKELSRLGFVVVPVAIPLDVKAQTAVYTFVYSDLVKDHGTRIRDNPELFQPETLARLRLGLTITEGQRRDAAGIRDRFRAGMRRVFRSVDAIVTPAMPVDVPQIDENADVLRRTRRLGQLTYPWSLHTGPTLTVPIGFHPDSGMPVGAQITAPADHEGALFAIARAYQSTTGWHQCLPPHSG